MKILEYSKSMVILEFCYEEFIFDLCGILKFIYEFLVVV